MDNTGCYINRFCLSWTILVFKSPCCYWLLYIPGLCAMNKTGWYITRFCPRQKNLGDIPTITVNNRQNWVIYQPFLFITYNIQQNRVIYQPVLFMAHNPGIYNNQYCSRQTKQGDLPTNIVHDRQNQLI